MRVLSSWAWYSNDCLLKGCECCSCLDCYCRLEKVEVHKDFSCFRSHSNHLDYQFRHDLGHYMYDHSYPKVFWSWVVVATFDYMNRSSCLLHSSFTYQWFFYSTPLLALKYSIDYYLRCLLLRILACWCWSHFASCSPSRGCFQQCFWHAGSGSIHER